MKCDEISIGLKVKTLRLEDTKGMMIKPHHLDCRKSGITGSIVGYVPGHGGDVWWVRHDGDGSIGAYCFMELEATGK